MHPTIQFTEVAAGLLQKMLIDHPTLVLLLDDTSCCSNSNVMTREGEPSWPVVLLANINGLRVYINPVLGKSLKADKILIDVLDFADDSLSLETNYGKRFVMSTELGVSSST